jgi:hypothetical protein
MIPRVRMARKRLAIARERSESAVWAKDQHDSWDNVLPPSYFAARWRIARRQETLRAIERRKDRIC